MVLKSSLIILTILHGTSAVCIPGDENCAANYDGEDTGLAQIKAHRASKENRQPKSGEVVASADNAVIDNAEANGDALSGHKAGDDTPWYQECQQLCTDTHGCVAWTFPKGQHKCYMKEKINWPKGFSLNYDTFSGNPASGGWIQAWGYEKAIDHTESHGESHSMGGPETSCGEFLDRWGCAECCKDFAAWTFEYNDDRHLCWCKDVLPPMPWEYDESKVSGEGGYAPSKASGGQGGYRVRPVGDGQ